MLRSSTFSRALCAARASGTRPLAHPHLPGVLDEVEIAASQRRKLVRGRRIDAWSTGWNATQLETQEQFRLLVGIPEQFSWSTRGCCVTCSSSESALLLALQAARSRVNARSSSRSIVTEGVDSRQLVIYCHPQQEVHVRRVAGIAGFGVVRIVDAPYCPQRRNHFLCPETFRRRLEEDEALGLIPCAVVCTFGTYATGSTDPLSEIRAVLAGRTPWVHVDSTFGWCESVCHTTLSQTNQADSISCDPNTGLGLSSTGENLLYFSDRGPALKSWKCASVRSPELECAIPESLEAYRYALDQRSGSHAMIELQCSLGKGLEFWRDAALVQQRSADRLERAIQASGAGTIVTRGNNVLGISLRVAIPFKRFVDDMNQLGFDVSTALADRNTRLVTLGVGREEIDESIAKEFADAMGIVTHRYRA